MPSGKLAGRVSPTMRGEHGGTTKSGLLDVLWRARRKTNSWSLMRRRNQCSFSVRSMIIGRPCSPSCDKCCQHYQAGLSGRHYFIRRHLDSVCSSAGSTTGISTCSSIKLPSNDTSFCGDEGQTNIDGSIKIDYNTASDDTCNAVISRIAPGVPAGPSGGGNFDQSMLHQMSVDFDDDIHLKRQMTLSTSLKEWKIPFESIRIEEKVHEGINGTLYRARWYGQVALKMIAIDPSQDDYDTRLRLFKLEVIMMKKLRHDNLVLFCGACLDPPNLGVVTSWLQGPCLHQRIHLYKERLPYSMTINLASQIALAMSYLHSRRFLHKDLRTKNIFLERGSTIVLTDYGLSVTHLSLGTKDTKTNMIAIRKNVLPYLAPEIITLLRPGLTNLKYTEHTDVYSFGTVYYEMITSQFPWGSQPAEVTIWNVGNGVMQSISSTRVNELSKDLIMQCWKYRPCDRPEFVSIHTNLKKMFSMNRSLARSPSTPGRLRENNDFHGMTKTGNFS